MYNLLSLRILAAAVPLTQRGLLLQSVWLTRLGLVDDGLPFLADLLVGDLGNASLDCLDQGGLVFPNSDFQSFLNYVISVRVSDQA